MESGEVYRDYVRVIMASCLVAAFSSLNSPIFSGLGFSRP